MTMPAVRGTPPTVMSFVAIVFAVRRHVTNNAAHVMNLQLMAVRSYYGAPRPPRSAAGAGSHQALDRVRLAEVERVVGERHGPESGRPRVALPGVDEPAGARTDGAGRARARHVGGAHSLLPPSGREGGDDLARAAAHLAAIGTDRGQVEPLAQLGDLFA